jgi:hypothetical protein
MNMKQLKSRPKLGKEIGYILYMFLSFMLHIKNALRMNDTFTDCKW